MNYYYTIRGTDHYELSAFVTRAQIIKTAQEETEREGVSWAEYCLLNTDYDAKEYGGVTDVEEFLLAIDKLGDAGRIFRVYEMGKGPEVVEFRRIANEYGIGHLAKNLTELQTLIDAHSAILNPDNERPTVTFSVRSGK